MKVLWGTLVPALLAGGVAQCAHAQSSVSLYGVLDQGINYTSNVKGHSLVSMKSNDLVGNRWGLRGSEDLGGGLSAVFRVENGFDVNAGTNRQGGREFGRQAYVGLSSSRFGTLTLGRQYDPSVDLWSSVTAVGQWGGNLAAHPMDGDNADWDWRANNSVKYVTPNYHGLTGDVMYAFSNQAGGFANNRMYALATQYKLNGLKVALAYVNLDHPGGTDGAVTADSSFYGGSQQNYDAAIAYKFGKAQLGFAYSHVQVDDPTGGFYMSSGKSEPNAGTWSSWKLDNFELNGEYFFRPDTWLGASYTFTQGRLTSTARQYQPKWHQVTMILGYDISVRTTFYIQGTYQHIVSANTGTAFDFAQTPTFVGLSSNGNQAIVRVAMMHKF